MPKKGIPEKGKEALHPIPVSDNAFSKIGMDLIGPLEKIKDGRFRSSVHNGYVDVSSVSPREKR